jgi:choloylglycine hydrolase
MDFSGDYGAKLLFVPRRYPQPLDFDTSKKPVELPFAFLGIGVLEGKTPHMLDGVNEHGLCGVNNYYPGYASTGQAVHGKRSVAPSMALQYVLGTCRSLDEAEEAFRSGIILVPASSPLLGLVPPLHYMLADRSGKCLIVEPDSDGIKIYRNNIGVMTNSPSYPWHETNLRNYLGLRREPDEAAEIEGNKLEPLSLNSGLIGLPGDYTSVSRFVRAAYLRHFATTAKDELDGVTLAMHLLDSVGVAKGLSTRGDVATYTVYSAIMCAESQRYYFSHYNDRRISVAEFGSHDLEASEIAAHEWSKGQDMRPLA